MMVKCQFYWWRKPEYPEETTDLRQGAGETCTQIYIQLGYKCDLYSIYCLGKVNMREWPMG